jgi:hypothetical protein
LERKKLYKLNGTFFFPQEIQKEKEREENLVYEDDFLFIVVVCDVLNCKDV